MNRVRTFPKKDKQMTDRLRVQIPKKTVILLVQNLLKIMIFYISKKNSKKIMKNIKFGLQVYFIMKIMLSCSD